MGGGGGPHDACRFYYAIMRNGNVALLNLRKGRVALSILGVYAHLRLSYLLNELASRAMVEKA